MQKSKRWFTPRLTELLTSKRQAELAWRKHPSPETKLAYSTLAKTYKTEVVKAKADDYNARIAAAGSDTKELFRILRELETPVTPPSNITRDNQWCQGIQDALTGKIALLQTKIDAKLASLPLKNTQNHQPLEHQFAPFVFHPLSQAEVAKIIKGLKPSPCKGDAFPAPLAKECITPLIPLITDFINASFATGSVPSSIKEAWISPLLKKPTLDPAIPTNFRPITTVPFLLKILDRAAYLQIQAFLESNRLLGVRQSGFRPGHGTETALLDLKIQLDHVRDQGGLALLLLLDLSAAFDLVDHSTLCTHLSTSAHFSPLATEWVRSFLSDRTARVYYETHAAAPTEVCCGVPQGSCVSPTLYNIYTRPLFDELDRLGVSYTNFADDTQILLPLSGNHQKDTALLNSIYNTIQNWMAQQRLCLNDDKTEILIVGTPSSLKSLSADYSSLTVAGFAIPVAKHVKTLGVYLDAELSMSRQVNAILSSTSYHIKLINQIRPFLSTDNCATIARAVIGSKLDYCNVLLAGTTTKNLKRLQTAQNNAVRAVFGLGSRDHVTAARRSLHWLPIKERIDFKILSLTHRCLHGTAPPYLSTAITARTHVRALRSTKLNHLAIPRFKRQRAGGTSFTSVAPRLWNSLPSHLSDEPLYWRFRKMLKTWLFNQAT